MKIDNLKFQVLEKAADRVLFEIVFSEDTGFFDGHFPDFKLLPGVLQTHLAIRLMEKQLETKFHVTGFKRIKFFSPIFPGSVVCLECTRKPDLAELHFRYFSGESDYSSGVAAVKND